MPPQKLFPDTPQSNPARRSGAVLVAPQGLQAVVAPVFLAMKAYWPLLATVAAYGVLVRVWFGGMGWDSSPIETLENTLLFLLATSPVFAMWRLAAYAMQGMPKSPLRQLWRDARDIIGNPARLVSLVVLFPAMYLFLKAFAIFKGNIAYQNPFSWDDTFMRLDAWLHGGIQPWQWLHPLLQSVPATFMINFIYNFWFFLSVGALLWAVGQRRPREEAVRFLLAFLMVWIIGGSFMALAFSSAGPAYYELLGLSPNPYAPLMDHLKAVAQSVPVWALDTQKALWDGYQAHDVTLGGISAFPSMHNAQAMLIALLAWRFGGTMRWSMVAFAMFIAIGSVWLGWHYAVDAYAGIAIAVASWWLAAPLARWMMQRPAMHQLADLQRRIDSQPQRAGE